MGKLLSLDIATKTGWRTATSSGVWDLKPNRGESEGMRVVRFKAKVREMKALHWFLTKGQQDCINQA